MQNAPVISVVMPFYNAGQYLKESIESILNQSFTNFELLAIDDGSEDDSLSIVTGYKDNRIKIIRNPHNYIKSLNTGITLAQGKYIARMDADDIMLPHRFKTQYAFMEANPHIDICGGWMKSFGRDEMEIRRSAENAILHPNMLFETPLFHPTVIMKSTIREQFPFTDGCYTCYNPNYIYAEDFKLWIDLAIKGFVFANIPDVLIHYRRSVSQNTTLHKEKMLDLTLKIRGEFSEWVMEKITKKDEQYFPLFDSLINLHNNGKLPFASLSKIIHTIYSPMLRTHDF